MYNLIFLIIFSLALYSFVLLIIRRLILIQLVILLKGILILVLLPVILLFLLILTPSSSSPLRVDSLSPSPHHSDNPDPALGVPMLLHSSSCSAFVLT